MRGRLKVGQVWVDGYGVELTVAETADLLRQQEMGGHWILVDDYGKAYAYNDDGTMPYSIQPKDNLVSLLKDVSE